MSRDPAYHCAMTCKTSLTLSLVYVFIPASDQESQRQTLQPMRALNSPKSRDCGDLEVSHITVCFRHPSHPSTCDATGLHGLAIKGVDGMTTNHPTRPTMKL